MAKAVFQRNQKVWVESVGCWAAVEKVVPVWTKGFDEPVRVTYDVGLGREFQAHELRAEEAAAASGPDLPDGPGWRLLRGHNKWQQPADTPHHPFPGTYPIVVTDAQDWGGWRVPGAEYDRDPRKIELQARLIARAPALRALARADRTGLGVAGGRPAGGAHPGPARGRPGAADPGSAGGGRGSSRGGVRRRRAGPCKASPSPHLRCINVS